MTKKQNRSKSNKKDQSSSSEDEKDLEEVKESSLIGEFQNEASRDEAGSQ